MLSTVVSSNSTTGSRLEDWLQASSRAFNDSGYCWGVVSCFSIRLPITRASSWLSRTERSYWLRTTSPRDWRIGAGHASINGSGHIGPVSMD